MRKTTSPALVSLDKNLDSVPPSKGDKLFNFDEEDLTSIQHHDVFGNRIRCADCDRIIPLEVNVCWGKGRWLCEPCYDNQFG